MPTGHIVIACVITALIALPTHARATEQTAQQMEACFSASIAITSLAQFDETQKQMPDKLTEFAAKAAPAAAHLSRPFVDAWKSDQDMRRQAAGQIAKLQSAFCGG